MVKTRVRGRKSQRAGTVQHVAMWRAGRADPARGGGSQQEGRADLARSGAGGSRRGRRLPAGRGGGSRRGGWKRSGSQEVHRRRGGCATHEPLLPPLQHGVEREHLEAATATTAAQYEGVVDVSMADDEVLSDLLLLDTMGVAD